MKIRKSIGIDISLTNKELFINYLEKI